MLEINSLVQMWVEFLSNGLVALQLNGKGPALAMAAAGTVAVMPFEETADELFMLTTLGPNEIHLLEPLEPPRPLFIHYGKEFSAPILDRAEVDSVRERIAGSLAEQTPPRRYPEREKISRDVSWTFYVQTAQRILREEGYTDENTTVAFRFGLYGPCIDPTPPRLFPAQASDVTAESASS